MTKREVENYLFRINEWFMFHTGKSLTDETAKLDSKTVSRIFIESTIDPQPQERRILEIQNEWERVYWSVVDLNKKKKEAD